MVCGSWRNPPDIITPNLTEAALLLGLPYEAVQAADAFAVIRQLSLDGQRSIVLTGYSAGDCQTGALCFDRTDGSVQAVQVPRVPRDFSGTGDPVHKRPHRGYGQGGIPGPGRPGCG